MQGATESLGMNTLIKDFSSDVDIQMHLDAFAAKGIVERRGLSKLSHIDVNVLWLQEVSGRKVVPLAKVTGERNAAELTTKHLTAVLIVKNIARMGMKYEAGRAEKAARLHSIGVRNHKVESSTGEIDRLLSSIHTFDQNLMWKKLRAAANDLRGGDRWKARGAERVWHRWHVSPRLALFSPYKFAKGPNKHVSFSQNKFHLRCNRERPIVRVCRCLDTARQ